MMHGCASQKGAATSGSFRASSAHSRNSPRSPSSTALLSPAVSVFAIRACRTQFLLTRRSKGCSRSASRRVMPSRRKPRKQLQGDAGMLDTIATGLSGLALFQVTQGQITGSAAENFWNAFGAERMLGSSVVAAGFGLLGLYQLLQGQWLGSASSLFFYALAGHQLATFQQAPSATTDLSEPPKPPRKQRKPPRKNAVPRRRGKDWNISSAMTSVCRAKHPNASIWSDRGRHRS